MRRVLVELRNVRKAYGAVMAVNDVSLEIFQGEFLTLLGPSGSGKTTTLMLIAGFEPPTAGEILIGGESVTARPPEKRDIGMVFQNYALFPHMTVFDNVAFPLRMRKVPRAELGARVREALELVRLPGLENRYPRQLSGGQQQRVALARALVGRPSLLLMDEPLSALDKKLREEMQGELKAIQRELGVSTLYVTHDQQEALALSDRVAVTNRGNVVQVGRPIDLYEQPADPFIAGFLGDVNFIEGSVVGSEAGAVRVKVTGGLVVVAATPARLAPGKRVVLSIRPERLGIAPLGQATGNGWPGIVGDVVFHGELLRYAVELADGLRLKVTRQYQGEASLLSVGSRVLLSTDPRDWKVFD